MLTERTLKKWRYEALCDQNPSVTLSDDKINVDILLTRVQELSQRILRMTQELLDQHLMRRK